MGRNAIRGTRELHTVTCTAGHLGSSFGCRTRLIEQVRIVS